MERIRIIDSHTAGEPTRVVLEGGPDLGGGSLAERRTVFRERCDAFRRAVVNEPRGSDVLVGALLCPPADPRCAAGVIFFNNVGYLGMCGHGTIGLVTTLAHLGRLEPGEHRVETPVGTVGVHLHADGAATVENVESYRLAAGLAVQVPGHGTVTGDVAWGGNWFFLSADHGQEISAGRTAELGAFAGRLRAALDEAGVRGAQGAPIDHIELLGPGGPGADSRSFVLCPGGAYDRSPCGTGTSAELACLAAAGRLAPGAPWMQESVIGSRFEASYTPAGGERIRPRVTGRAFLTLEGSLLLDAEDPFCWGLPGA